MKPIKFSGMNRILTLPPGWNELKRGCCDDLPVMVKDGSCVSCWELTEKERKAVMEGKNILGHIVGGTQPPIKLTVEGNL